MSAIFARFAGLASIVAVVFSGPMRAEQILFRAQDWTVSAPDAIDCSRPPTLTVRGPGTLFEESNRANLQGITIGIGPSLTRQCSNLSEAVLVNGRTRRLVTLKTATQSAATPQPAAASRETKSEPSPLERASERQVSPPPSTPQINMPSAPRPASSVSAASFAPYQNRRLQSLDSARDIEDKCEVLLKWLGRLDQEYPERASNRFAFQNNAIYLYRDEDFIQVFGQPFDQTTTKDRAEIHANFISRCQGRMSPPRPGAVRIGGLPIGGVRQQPLRAYASQFQPFSAILDGPFLSQPGQFSPVAINAAVAKGREAHAWMMRTLSDLESKPPTAETFRDLGQYIGADVSLQAGVRGSSSQDQLASLWRSEQKYFTEAAMKRRTEVATSAVDKWLTEMNGLGGTLADADKLKEERQQRNEVLDALDSAMKSEVMAKYNAKLDAILDPLVRQRIDQLSAIPPALPGIKQALYLQTVFTRDFQSYSDRPTVARWEEAYASSRNRMLTAALPEWRQAVKVNNLTDEKLKGLSDDLRAFFPSTPKEELYDQYEEALTAVVEKKHQADLAKAVNQCDALAAHPQDPEATVAGVVDEKVNAPAAISSCELAIKQNGVPPRLRFQLARAYLGAGRLEDAVEQLLAAAEEGHGASLAYLADIYLDGVPGIEADPDLAYSLLEKAVEAGFAPAKAVMAEFKDVTKEVAEADAEEAALMAELKKTNPELFTQASAGPAPERKPVNPESVDFQSFFAPNRARNNYNGRLIELFEQYRSGVRGLSYDLRDEIFEYFAAALKFLKREEFDSACPALVDDEFSNAIQIAESQMDALYRKRVNNPELDGKNDPVSGMAALLGNLVPGVRDKDYYDGLRQSREAGDFDMGALVYDYGGCSDAPVKRFYQNAKTFVMKYVSEYR